MTTALYALSAVLIVLLLLWAWGMLRYKKAVLIDQTDALFTEIAAELARLDAETLTALGLDDLQDIFKRLSAERAYVKGLKQQALLMLVVKAAKSSDAQKEKLRAKGLNLDLLLSQLQARVHVDLHALDGREQPSVNWAKAFTQKVLMLEGMANPNQSVWQNIAEALLCAVFSLQMNVAGAIQAAMIAQMTPAQTRRLESVQGLATRILPRRLESLEAQAGWKLALHLQQDKSSTEQKPLRKPPGNFKDRGNSR
ncbi:MAG: hypothetical protein INF44_01990 [Thalassospira sp.]|nr:hypothetical protein [Thalassospira sp.]